MSFFKKAIKLYKSTGKSTYRSALLKCVAVAIEHEKLLSLLHCDTIVDIGANRGQFALAARSVFPKAHIVSFEPLKIPADTFSDVFKDDQKVDLYRVAIGPKRGEATIHISKRDDSSSLLPIGSLQNAMFPGTAEVSTIKVQVGLLEDYISKEDVKEPAMLKIDVQGYELEVLKGCNNLLNKFLYIYVECSFVELYETQPLADSIILWLRERGYKLKGVYNMLYDRNGKAIQGDFLFTVI